MAVSIVKTQYTIDEFRHEMKLLGELIVSNNFTSLDLVLKSFASISRLTTINEAALEANEEADIHVLAYDILDDMLYLIKLIRGVLQTINMRNEESKNPFSNIDNLLVVMETTKRLWTIFFPDCPTGNCPGTPTYLLNQIVSEVQEIAYFVSETVYY